MSKFCPSLFAARGGIVLFVVLWLAICPVVMRAQQVNSTRETIAEADRLKSEWKSDSLRQAAKKYAKAQAALHLAGEFRTEAEVLEKLGDVYTILSDYQSAIVQYNRALPLLTSSNNERLKVSILTKLGSAYLEMADVKSALPHCTQALEISNRVNYEEGAVLAMNCLGVASSIASEVSQAQDYLEHALAIAQRIKVDTPLALTHLNLGYLHSNLGNIELALSSYKSALAIWQATNDQQKQASTLTAMAGVFAQQGEKQTAFDLHNQALKIFKTIGHRNGEAATLNGIGYLYDILGDRTEALNCYNRALQLFEAINNQHYAAVTMGYVGRVHFALDDRESALQVFNRKLAMSRVVQDRRMESYALTDIGDVLAAKKQTQQALAQYRQALLLSQEVLDRRGSAQILLRIGKLLAQLGDATEALNDFEQALSLMQAVADRRGEVQALLNTATAKRDLGRLDDARHDIECSLDLIEKLRTKVFSPSLRISYLETVYQHYEFYVDLLMRMHDASRALEVNEHARARTLLENLLAARTDIRQGVDPQLLSEERELQQRLNEKAEQQTRLLSSKTQPERESAIRNEVETLLVQYKEVESRVRDKSPRYAALTQPRPLGLAGIQEQLDDDTLLLEYSLEPERSYGWAVTKNSVTSFTLPARAEIKQRAQVFYDMLSQGSRSAQQASPSPAAYRAAANELSAMLLEPVALLLPGKRLVIVADGILQYIPFSALPEPTAKAAEGVPLMVNHEIVTLPSISALAVLRNEVRGRDAARKTLAVMADPVFQKDDPRVQPGRMQARAAAMRGSTSDELTIGSESENEPLVFERLPFSSEEAEGILKLAPQTEIMRAIGFDANLRTALDPALGQYRIIHFATHALLNNSHPELSGIVLSLVDQSGRSQNGFLRLNEIYNLNLSAELVVLSACQTALGKETHGEGLISLTRGFMYAGVPRVIATLWRINDRAAAEFMRYFYEALLSRHQSVSKSLRAAQIRMWQANKNAIPHYWAAFTLQGEWR